MINVAIFASGSGSNAEAIVRYFAAEGRAQQVRVACIICNNREAYVLRRAEYLHLPAHYMSNAEIRSEEQLLPLLAQYNIDYIVLAGFMTLISPFLLKAFPDRILNIHPALLPKHGGKGMYGMHVHEAVCRSGEKETGITIHLINEEYDRGAILFQARTTVEPSDTPDSVAEKVHRLEHQHYPEVIERWVLGLPMGGEA